MTKEEAIEVIRKEYACVDADCDIERNCGRCELHMPSKEPILKAYEMAIQALSQEPSGDVVSRQAVMRLIENKPYDWSNLTERHNMLMEIRKLPSVTQKSGKWIHFAQSDDCSECGWSTGKYISPSKYCPNCGACMKDGRTLDEFIEDSKESEDKV